MLRINGAAIAAKILEETKLRSEPLRGRGIRPGLAVVLVGEDPVNVGKPAMDDQRCLTIWTP